VKTIEEMLRSLARPEVTEFAVVTDRLPCIKVNGSFQPVADDAPSTDEILEMLVSTGGSRYVDSLGAKASQWTMRVEGLGTVGVTALMRDDVVQARFVLAKRDARLDAAAAGAPARPVAARGRLPSESDDVAQSPRAGIGRADIDPRARGAGALGALAPPPAAAAALVGGEPVFDLEGSGARVPAHPGRTIDLDPAPSSSPIALELDDPATPTGKPPAASVAPHAAGAHVSPLSPRLAPVPPPPASHSTGAAAASGAIENLLRQARAANASDLHIVPERPVLFRVAGDLTSRGQPIDEAFAMGIVDGIVPLRLRPQLETEGSCDFALTDNQGRFRVNVSRQRTGHKICVRLVSAEIPTLESLGLPPEIAAATHHHQGLIVVTGPTGHGKTSTLAAIVNIINTNTTHHIITVEDPVEYVHPRKRAMMSQREVGSNTRSFQSALKGSLREDPDVIVVGELRDTETVRMALSASETGHLVIGTMNTPSAAKTIDRLIDLFPPADQAQVRMTLAGGLRLIVSQRLIPNADRSGLVACAELLPGSIGLWSLIRDNKTFQIPSLQQRGKGIGIIRIDDSLVDLVKAGRTTLEIAKEWAESPEELELSVLGKRPQAAPPAQQKAAGDGIFGKAGNLFRKGG
jgi:twitching motility protein PilT